MEFRVSRTLAPSINVTAIRARRRTVAAWEKLLTHEISLEELPALFADLPDGYLKAIVRP
jgi:hypothetical protein